MGNVASIYIYFFFPNYHHLHLCIQFSGLVALHVYVEKYFPVTFL